MADKIAQTDDAKSFIDQRHSSETLANDVYATPIGARIPINSERAPADSGSSSSSLGPVKRNTKPRASHNSERANSVVGKKVEVRNDTSLTSGCDVVRAASKNLSATKSEITLTIEKGYRGRASQLGKEYCVAGEIHNIPWNKYVPVTDGLIALASEVLSLPANDVKLESETRTVEGMIRASFKILIPRKMSDQEQSNLDVAISVYGQRLKDQGKQIVLDLFSSANPEMVDVGVRAAEQVRRASGGASLPVKAALRAGASSKAVDLPIRIGRHPDAARDLPERQLQGYVVTISTEPHRFALREVDVLMPEADKAGMAQAKGMMQTIRKGKLNLVQYDDKIWRLKVLDLPLGKEVLVKLAVIPKLARGKERLSLSSLGNAGEYARNSNSTT